MESHVVIGAVLVLAGIVDASMIPVLRRRTPDPSQAAILTGVLASSAGGMILLGILFLTGFLARPGG